MAARARTGMALLALLAGLLALPSIAHGAGDLDPSFDGDGKVLTDFGGTFDGIGGIAIQTDGKIVAAGQSRGTESDSDSALARYNADGSLDASFDGDGKLVTNFGAYDYASDVAIQGDGKIITAGASGNDFALARYNADGSLDTSFDGDGKVLTDFGGIDYARGVAIQGDGKIVAAGANDTQTALARYNADGSLDTSFDGDGKVTDSAGDEFDDASAVAIQPDGKIVAAGSSGHCDCPLGGGVTSSFKLARLNANGSRDTSFGGDGVVLTSFETSGYDTAKGVVIQADGKIVAAGGSSAGVNPYNFALARYNANGSLDTSFDADGKVLTDFGAHDTASSVALQTDGKIVALGLSSAGNNGFNFALARYNSNGSLNAPTFGGDGKVLTDFGGDDFGGDVAIQADGKIVASGRSGLAANTGDFALARYIPTGPASRVSINDVTRLEGNAGLTSFTFTVALSKPSSETITVSRQTANGTASTPADYTALNPATITFLPGQTNKTVTVKVKGEVAIEPNETFFVNLSSPTNATIADGQGKGTIQNDDLSPTAACTITGTRGNDVLNGTSGNDVICGGRGDDQIYGLDGADVLKGEVGNDLLVGGNGYDLLLGDRGIDDLRGANGNDTLRGGDEADTLNAGPSSDALFGDAGADSLNAQDGVSANDSADGGSDSDSCVFDSGDFVTNCP
jgi:uncharacterized delta-60 repeat protein